MTLDEIRAELKRLAASGLIVLERNGNVYRMVPIKIGAEGAAAADRYNELAVPHSKMRRQ